MTYFAIVVHRYDMENDRTRTSLHNKFFKSRKKANEERERLFNLDETTGIQIIPIKLER